MKTAKARKGNAGSGEAAGGGRQNQARALETVCLNYRQKNPKSQLVGTGKARKRARKLAVRKLNAVLFKVTGGRDPHVVKRFTVPAVHYECDCKGHRAASGGWCSHAIAVKFYVDGDPTGKGRR